MSGDHNMNQKPVAWVCEGYASDEKHSIDYQQEDIDALPVGTMLYTTPPAAPRQEQYDQTSLELCKECGWKAIIPGDGCLICARQKAQPVAWQGVHDKTDLYYRKPVQGDVRPLYAAPRQWVEQTDDEARALVNRATFGDRTNWQALVYMIDAKLKEKNA